MEISTLIINGIFYFILTAFFIYIFVREKQLTEKMNKMKDRVTDAVIKKNLLLPLNIKTGILSINFIGALAFILYALKTEKINNMDKAALILIPVAIGLIFYDKNKTKTWISDIYPAMTIFLIAVAGYDAFMTIDGMKLIPTIYYFVNAFLFIVYSFGGAPSLKENVHLLETATTLVVLVLLLQNFYLGNYLVPTSSMVPTITPGDRLFANNFIYKFEKPKRGDIIVFNNPADERLFTKRLAGLPGEHIKIGADNKLYINGKIISDEKFKISEKLISFVKNKLEAEKTTGTKQLEMIEEDKNYYDGLSGKDNYFRYYLGEGMNIGVEGITVPKKGDLYSFDIQNNRFMVNGKDEAPVIYDFVKDPMKWVELKQGKSIKLTEDYYIGFGDNSGNSWDSRYWGAIAEHRMKGAAFVRIFPFNRAGLIK